MQVCEWNYILKNFYTLHCTGISGQFHSPAVLTPREMVTITHWSEDGWNLESIKTIVKKRLISHFCRLYKHGTSIIHFVTYSDTDWAAAASNVNNAVSFDFCKSPT
jgi:hypothetical protein